MKIFDGHAQLFLQLADQGFFEAFSVFNETNRQG